MALTWKGTGQTLANFYSGRNFRENPYNPIKGMAQSANSVPGWLGNDSGKRGVQKVFDFFLGKNSRQKNVNLLSPEQEEIMSELFDNPIENNPLYQQGSSYLQNLYSQGPEGQQQFDQPILDRFQNDISPSISNRFGGNNGGSLDSALQHALGSLSQNLESQRAQTRFNSLPITSQYAQQPQTNLQNLTNMRTFQPIQTSGKKGFLTQAIGAYYGGGGGFGGGGGGGG